MARTQIKPELLLDNFAVPCTYCYDTWKFTDRFMLFNQHLTFRSRLKYFRFRLLQGSRCTTLPTCRFDYQMLPQFFGLSQMVRQNCYYTLESKQTKYLVISKVLCFRSFPTERAKYLERIREVLKALKGDALIHPISTLSCLRI